MALRSRMAIDKEAIAAVRVEVPCVICRGRWWTTVLPVRDPSPDVCLICPSCWGDEPDDNLGEQA
jgi:hypothetical protein